MARAQLLTLDTPCDPATLFFASRARSECPECRDGDMKTQAACGLALALIEAAEFLGEEQNAPIRL